MFDLKELESFVSVIETRSLTESSRQLGLPKSTMSRRIRQLESSLGQTLLRRESNRLIPTEAGQLFNRYCEEILRLAQSGCSALEELREEVSGQVQVCCHDALLRSWFSPLVVDFLDRYRGAELKVCTRLSPPEGDLNGGVCVWLGHEPDCGLRCERLGALQQGLYARPDYLQQRGCPQHPRELASHLWVELEGSGHQGLELWHPQEGGYRVLPAARRLTVDRLAMQIDAVIHAGGFGLMPRWVIAKRLSHHPGTLQGCLQEWYGPALGVWLLYPHGQLPRRTQAFLNHVRQSVPLQWQECQAAAPCTHPGCKEV